MSILSFIIIPSAVLQILAAYLALKNIKISKKQIAWTLISLAVVLMGLRRLISLFKMGATTYLINSSLISADIVFELTGLLLSALMFVGVYKIAPMLKEIARAEKKHMETERQFWETMENINLIVVGLDINGKIDFCNDFFVKVTGWERQAVMGQDWFELFAPEKFVRHIFEKAVRTGNLMIHAENEICLRDGSRRLIQWNNTLRRNDEGVVIGTLSIGEDITMRRQIEHELIDSEDKYRRLIEGAPDAIVVHSRNVIRYANIAAVRLLGFSGAGAMVGRNIYDLIDEQFHDAVRDRLSIIARRKEAVPKMEMRLKRQDGEPVSVEITSIPFSFGGEEAVQSIVHDITERKRRDWYLRLLVSALENTQLGITITNDKGTIVFANPADAAMHGYRIDELMGKQITVYAPEHLRNDMFGEWLRSKKSEYLNVRKNGEMFPVQVTTDTVNDGEGRPLGIVSISQDITERLQTEQQLSKLSCTVEQSPESIIITDYRGHIEYVNPKFTELTGYTSDEVLGKTPRVLKSGRTSAQEYKELWKTITAGNVWRGELYNRKKDGTFYWESVSISPVKDHDGVITHFVAFKEDITARKQMEEDLRQNEERFRAAFDNAPIGEALIALDGRYLRVNDAFCRTLGYSEAELLTKRFQDITFPDDLGRDVSAFDSLLRGEMRSYVREKRYIHKNGITIWALLSVSVVKNIKNRPQYVISQILDVTEQRRVEQMIKQRQEALMSVYRLATTLNTPFESLCDNVVRTLAGLLKFPYAGINMFEKGQMRMTSFLVDDVFVREDMTQAFAEPCFSVFRSKHIKILSGDLAERFSANSIFTKYPIKSYVGIPVITSAGNVMATLCLMDRTVRPFKEEDIHLMEIFATYIAREIEKRSLENQLFDAQKMKILGQLTGGVAHEVRNPLNAISAITEVLEQELGADPEYQPLIEQILVHVERLSRLMKDLLALGKPVNASDMCEISLNQLVVSTLGLYQRSKRYSNEVLFQCEDTEGMMCVFVDPQKIQQVLINLIDNACQHSPAGSNVTVVLSKKDDQAVMQIVDKGSGIPPENLARLFDPFFTTRKGGTGLGLSLVKHIVDVHNGTIQIYNNTSGPGCTSEVTIPLVTNHESQNTDR